MSDSWPPSTLGEVADYINGYAFAPVDWSERGLPIIRIEQMMKPTASFDCYTGTLAPQYLVTRGDLIFSWSATLATRIWKRGDAWLNQHLFKVVPKGDNDLSFTHHLLDFHMETLAGQSHGTTMKHITRKDLLPFPIRLPEPAEQRAIAKVLDVADEAIEKTELLIQHLQQAMTGLLHDLLTRGIDEHGQLRDPEADPEQFHQTELGLLPRDWEVHPLAHLTELQVGYAFKSQWFREDEGIRLLRGENVGTGLALWKETRFLPALMAPQFREYELECGDIIIGMDRTVTGQGWKITRLRAVDVPALLVQRVGRFKPVRCSADYLHAVLTSANYRRMLLREQKGMDIPHLSQTEILSPLVPLPQSDEQARIAGAVEAGQQRLSSERANLLQLRRLKSGLMDDLLTGRVRVPEAVTA